MDYTCDLLEYKEADLFTGGKKILKWIPHKWGEKIGTRLVYFRIQYMAGFCKSDKEYSGPLKTRIFLVSC